MLFKYLRLWWTSQIRILGKENYIRLYPNPGFRIVWGKPRKEFRWNRFYGFHKGSER